MPAGANLGTIASISLRDAGNEPTVFSIYGAVLTDANFVAKQALWDTLVTKTMALVLGAKAATRYGTQTNFDWDQPTNGAAREIALTVSYKDNTTGQRFTAAVGTLNPTIPGYIVNVNARDVISMGTPTAITEWLTAFNAFAINPYTGNTCVAIGLRVTRGKK